MIQQRGDSDEPLGVEPALFDRLEETLRECEEWDPVEQRWFKCYPFVSTELLNRGIRNVMFKGVAVFPRQSSGSP